jgi:hypothetical protein
VGRRHSFGTSRRLTELFAALCSVACSAAGHGPDVDRPSDDDGAPPTSLEDVPKAPTELDELTPNTDGELSCAGTRLDELTPSQPFDAVEQRRACAASATEVLDSFGASCSAGACAAAVAGADAERVAELASTTLACVIYWVAMRGDELIFAGTQPELVQLLLPIDTLDEARLALAYPCARAWSDGNGFSILSTRTEGECFETYRHDDLWRVAADGQVTQLDQATTRTNGVCVGRRPHGLRDARGSRGASALGEHFAQSAELEAASVVAFLELARSLRAHGAPASLVRRARHAARDEIRHARTMTRFARRFGAEPHPRRIDAPAHTSLEALATENAVEGCVVETWGALVGSVQAREAASAAVRATMRRIAADETRHAALSWDLACWFDSKLDPDARARVAAARRRAALRLLAGARVEPARALSDELGVPCARTAERLARGLAATLWQDRAPAA